MNALSLTPVSIESPLTLGSHPDDRKRIGDAAQQFEALLLGQILKSARTGGGWLGSGSDGASDCATSFAEQFLATTLAQNGGLGLAGLIEDGLASPAKAQHPANQRGALLDTPQPAHSDVGRAVR